MDGRESVSCLVSAEIILLKLYVANLLSFLMIEKCPPYRLAFSIGAAFGLNGSLWLEQRVLW